MKISIKTYEYQRVEKTNTEFTLPDVPTYWFETHIRRSIRIIPVYSTWITEKTGQPEEILSYEITCVYDNFETHIDKFSIAVNNIEDLYHEKEQGNKSQESFVKAWLRGWFDERTEERFLQDLHSVINKIVAVP